MRDINDDCTCANPFSLSHTHTNNHHLECANNNATIILLADVHSNGLVGATVLFYLFSLTHQINI